MNLGPLTLSPVAAATLAACGTWFLTALGSVPVLFFRTAPRRLMDALMGFAAGVMVAASCWSLLTPALDLGGIAPTVAGLAAGAALIWGLDQTLPHLHPEFPDEARPEGLGVTWRRTTLLIAAITLHNFPEGLAIGVAFGGRESSAALALALGIGLQNIPEGLAVALPLRRDGMNRWKALWYGQLTAVVEPVAAFLGAFVVSQAVVLLPFALALAAGAMLYVVVEELIPETVRSGSIDVATIGFIVGFAVMMSLDNLVG
jgi:ZIP family zinc transporter